MVICPLCRDKFKDLRGLNGHLRFKHDLEGDELDRVYSKAKEQQREEQELRRAPSITEIREMIRDEVSGMSDSLTGVETVGSGDLSDELGSEGGSLLELVDTYRMWQDRVEVLENAKPAFSWDGFSDRLRRLQEACKRKAEEARKQLKEEWKNG